MQLSLIHIFSYLEQVAPQIVPIIKELDLRMKGRYQDPKVAIIDDQNRVHMAHMDIHYGYSVNGVAALHTDILKHSELKPFYDIYPEKFNNKTNGITFRLSLIHIFCWRKGIITGRGLPTR